MEELDSDSAQQRETFACFGLAAYHAQCVEKSIAILVSSVFNKEFLKNNPEYRDDFFCENFKKTLGHLVKKLNQLVSVPGNLEKTLIEALEKRNWLVHDYFYERAGEILSTKGRKKMISELTEISEFFSNLDSHLTSIYKKWANKIGVTQKEIEESLIKLSKDAEESV